MGTGKDKITLDTVVVRNKDIIFSEVDGEVVLLSPDMKEYLGMNETGSRIWEMMGKNIPINAILNEVKKEFELDDLIYENQIIEFVNELIYHELVEIKG